MTEDIIPHERVEEIRKRRAFLESQLDKTEGFRVRLEHQAGYLGAKEPKSLVRVALAEMAANRNFDALSSSEDILRVMDKEIFPKLIQKQRFVEKIAKKSEVEWPVIK